MPRELLRRERADRLRHRRARRRPGLLRRQDAGRPHVLLLRHPALPRRPELPSAAGEPGQERARSRTNQRDGQMAYGVDHARARTRTSTTSRRSLGGLREADVPRPRRAGPGDHRPAHPQADPAHQRLPAGRRALPAVASSGRRTTSSPTWSARSSQCDRPIQERMVWHFFLCRGRAGPAGRRRHRHRRRRRPAPAAAADPDADRGRGRSALANLGKNGPRDVSGMTMTHCVENERVVTSR